MLMIISIDTYALALFEVGSNEDREMKFYKELQKFGKYLEDSKVKQALNRSLADYRVFDGFWKSLKNDFSQEIVNVLRIIQEAALMSSYERLVHEYRKLLQKENLIHIVNISSPKELSEKEKDDVVKEVKRHYDGTLDVHYILDPSLVSGLKIRVNNDIYDTSIKNKFKQILAQGGLAHE